MAQLREAGDFWSRRRAAVRAEEEAEAETLRAAEQALAEEERARAEAEKTDAELLEELGLPDPDTLRPGDDFAAFMQRAVPERLRRRALRKLWTSNPVLANLDGLVDHGEDFTDAATVTPDLRTAYEVGRGMYEHVRSLAAQALEGAQEEAAAAPDEAAPEAPEAETVEAAAEPAAPRLREVAEYETAVEDMSEAAEPAPLPRRHMRFAFDS
ncbi:DUF3306 domain-containing protein [Actibacterium sp. MT2.3-13A]|uniref:DUF3306 domain-containing protein n=1 Tax=Actibacterium sp. MT2.3-13A TaxID=2828332 RepID=UPI001BA8604C|nr:DUF3306 domain-containing protein [Actibacterium sp. MT2.3-13A]